MVTGVQAFTQFIYANTSESGHIGYYNFEDNLSIIGRYNK